jgi:hypothetical protein
MTEPSLEGEKMRQAFEAIATREKWFDTAPEGIAPFKRRANGYFWESVDTAFLAYAAGCAAERERAAKIAESQPTNYAVQNACICYGGSSYPGPIKEALKCYGGIVASAIRGKEK